MAKKPAGEPHACDDTVAAFLQALQRAQSASSAPTKQKHERLDTLQSGEVGRLQEILSHVDAATVSDVLAVVEVIHRREHRAIDVEAAEAEAATLKRLQDEKHLSISWHSLNPDPVTPVPKGLLSRVTALNFWQTTINPEFGSVAGDWDWVERSAEMEAAARSAEVEKQHKSGNDRALLKFAQRSGAFVLKQPWVVNQLVAWRVEGSADSLARFIAVTKAMGQTRGRGSGKSGELRKNIHRNLSIYEFVLNAITGGSEVRRAVIDAAHKYGKGFETVLEIYEKYDRARDWHRDRRGAVAVALPDFIAWMKSLAARLPTGDQ